MTVHISCLSPHCLLKLHFAMGSLQWRNGVQIFQTRGSSKAPTAYHFTILRLLLLETPTWVVAFDHHPPLLEVACVGACGAASRSMAPRLKAHKQHQFNPCLFPTPPPPLAPPRSALAQRNEHFVFANLHSYTRFTTVVLLLVVCYKKQEDIHCPTKYPKPSECCQHSVCRAPRHAMDMPYCHKHRGGRKCSRGYCDENVQVGVNNIGHPFKVCQACAMQQRRGEP